MTQKTDIFALGLVLSEMTKDKKYSNQLMKLIRRMRVTDPAQRPTIEEVIGDPILKTANLIQSNHFKQQFCEAMRHRWLNRYFRDIDEEKTHQKWKENGQQPRDVFEQHYARYCKSILS